MEFLYQWHAFVIPCEHNNLTNPGMSDTKSSMLASDEDFV